MLHTAMVWHGLGHGLREGKGHLKVVVSDHLCPKMNKFSYDEGALFQDDNAGRDNAIYRDMRAN